MAYQPCVKYGTHQMFAYGYPTVVNLEGDEIGSKYGIAYTYKCDCGHMVFMAGDLHAGQPIYRYSNTSYFEYDGAIIASEGTSHKFIGSEKDLFYTESYTLDGYDFKKEG